MSENKAPAFQFYPNDFIGSTAAWTNEEAGIYLRLLCHQWSNDFIPDDERRIARIVGLSLDELRESWVVVGEKFKTAGKGKLKNDRLELVRKEQRAHRQNMSDKGKKGALKRWGKTGTDDRIIPFTKGDK